MGTALLWFSLQPHGDVAWHPPAAGAGWDQTLSQDRVTASPRAPRPVAPSEPTWWDVLCLNPTRNLLVPNGYRQKKWWFNFCSEGQTS